MSGSGGAGGGVGGFGTPDSDVKCDDLKFSTNLTSIDDEVLKSVEEGTWLDVKLSDDPVRSIQAQTSEGGILGAIVDSVPELIRCLQGGTEFDAEIKSLEGGIVRVEVSSR
jgi:hypothetical protein